MVVIVFFRYPLATFPGIWCHTPRGIAPAPAEATSLFSRRFPPPHHRCGVTEGRQTTTGNDWRFHMNTSNTIPADGKNTSPPSIWALIIEFMVSLLTSYFLIATLGPLEEFGLIPSKHCDQRNAKTRAKGSQLRDLTVGTCRATRFWDIAKPAHSCREHTPASTIMTHATGRQSGQRRTPRHGGQAKKPSNDPDGGDGEPPRPSRGLPSSRHPLPPLRHNLTRPVIAGGTR